MIVFCEECGSKNDIDPNQVVVEPGPVRCSECNDILRYSSPAVKKIDDPPSHASAPGHLLELRLGRLLLVMGPDRTTVTMGRQRHNDIEIVDTRVSRSHARIEFRNNQFILIDHSTNGTYVKLNDRDDTLNLKRSELTLEGAGEITLGRKIIDRPSRTIYFALKP